MAALIIPSMTPFGGLTNQTVGKLLSLNASMERLADAIATASSGYTGVAGTEFEAAVLTPNAVPTGIFSQQNNFGVQPRVDTPGAAGTDYAYAVNTLNEAWRTFWTAAEASINQLDNGGM
jgi:hypothetical protein